MFPWNTEQQSWEILIIYPRIRRVVRTAERIIGTTLPTLQDLYLSRVSKRSDEITLDPSHQHTHSLNCYHLVDATELWAPERPDTGTVSFPKQSISWTLDIKCGSHNTVMQLFNHHTHLFFHFKFAHQTCTHIIVCIVFCLFAILCIAYLYIILYYLCPVLLRSFCCTEELLSL